VSASDILATERAAPSGGSGGFLGAAVLTRSDVQPPAGAGSHAVGGNLDVVGFARARPRLMPDPRFRRLYAVVALSVSQGLARARPRLRLIARSRGLQEKGMIGTRHAPRPWVKAKREGSVPTRPTVRASVTTFANPVFSMAHDTPPFKETKTPRSVPM
jgi:hypothetical protein